MKYFQNSGRWEEAVEMDKIENSKIGGSGKDGNSIVTNTANICELAWDDFVVECERLWAQEIRRKENGAKDDFFKLLEDVVNVLKESVKGNIR